MNRAWLFALMVSSCTRREEARPAPETKPSAEPPPIEHTLEDLTCRDGVLGRPIPAVVSAKTADAPPRPEPPDAMPGLGSIGPFGVVASPPVRIVGHPVSARDGRALAFAKTACSASESFRVCHIAAHEPLGEMLFELVIDREGKVTKAERSGGALEDPALATCLAGAFRARSFDTSAAGTHAHSLTFSRDEQHPKVSTSTPRVTGGLSAVVVERIVRARLGQVRACYARTLAHDPHFAGKLVVSFAIEPSGAVSGSKLASSSITDPTLAGCITGVFAKMTFPTPSSPVTVEYPIELAP